MHQVSQYHNRDLTWTRRETEYCWWSVTWTTPWHLPYWRMLLLLLLMADDGRSVVLAQWQLCNGLRSAVACCQIAGDPVAGQFSVNDRRASLWCLCRHSRITDGARLQHSECTAWTAHWTHLTWLVVVQCGCWGGRLDPTLHPSRPLLASFVIGACQQSWRCDGRRWSSEIIDDDAAAAAALQQSECISGNQCDKEMAVEIVS